jgi:hypothetical protein
MLRRLLDSLKRSKKSTSPAVSISHDTKPNDAIDSFEELNINGIYDYKCILYGNEPFPDDSGGNAHGGTITIRTNKAKYGYQLDIEGNRLWKTNGHAKTFELEKKKNLPKPQKWFAREAAIISDNKIIYRYTVEGYPVEGVSIATINIHDSGVVITGVFSYFLNADYNATEKENYLKIKDRKILRKWAVRTGVIEIRNRRGW